MRFEPSLFLSGVLFLSTFVGMKIWDWRRGKDGVGCRGRLVALARVGRRVANPQLCAASSHRVGFRSFGRPQSACGLTGS